MKSISYIYCYISGVANIGNYGEVAKSSLLHCNVTGTSVEPHLNITVADITSLGLNNRNFK